MKIIKNKKSIFFIIAATSSLMIYTFTYERNENISLKKSAISKQYHLAELKEKILHSPNMTADIKNNLKNYDQTKTEKLIDNHLSVMHRGGKKAVQQYEQSLKELKKDADQATKELFILYNEQKENNYLKRQQIIETIRALQSPVSIPLLVQIAQTPLPPERSADIHHGSTRIEEGIIRLTAIEGLGYFASEGEIKSYEALQEIMSDEKSPLPIKRQAVRELLLSTKTSEELSLLKKEMKNFLPSNQHFIITEKIDSPDEQMPDIEVHQHDETELDRHHYNPPKIETH